MNKIIMETKEEKQKKLDELANRVVELNKEMAILVEEISTIEELEDGPEEEEEEEEEEL